MNKIPLKEAIASGAWLECNAKYFDEEFHFRLRVRAFKPTSVAEIDASLANQIQVEGKLWLMSVEIVSLCRKTVSAWCVAQCIKIIDEDGFEFERFNNRGDLCSDQNVLHRFRDQGTKLLPKIKTVGAIAYELPDEETKYFVAIEDGNIREA